MKRSIGRSAGWLLACTVAAGCGQADDEVAMATRPVVADSAADSIYVADRTRRSLPPERIYYTLTDHAWYARGEPLLHEGRQYLPQGRPEAASLEEMQPAGEYDGVQYYRRSGAADPVVYVPVFEGYWQVFRARSSD